MTEDKGTRLNEIAGQLEEHTRRWDAITALAVSAADGGNVELLEQLAQDFERVVVFARETLAEQLEIARDLREAEDRAARRARRPVFVPKADDGETLDLGASCGSG